MNYNPCHAIAKIYGSSLYPKLRGTVRFQQMHSGVMVTAEVFGLPSENDSGAGIFAFHIHEGSHCTSTEKEPFEGVGGHYNPNGCMHPYHAGDLPPLFGNHGYAYLSVFTDRFCVRDIVGRTVIIHGGPDDFVTQPSGNAGSKIACGKICTR